MTVTGIIQGVDCEILSYLGDHLLEKIKLRPQCMQKDEDRSLSGLDIANPAATDIAIGD